MKHRKNTDYSWMTGWVRYGLACAFWGSLAIGLTLAAPVVVILSNGDRLTAEIISETNDQVVLKSAVFGELTVPKTQISRREAIPTLPGASEKKPVVVTPPSAKSLVVVTNGPALKPYSVADPRHYFPGWMRPLTTNWHGNLQLGMDLGFGTTDRKTFYANAAATHAYDRFRNSLTYRAAYGTAETPVNGTTPRGSILTADSMEGLWKTDFDLATKRKIYLYHQAGGGFDEVRRYDLRFEEGMGVGYKLVDQVRLKINLETGIQFQHLRYKNGPHLLPALHDTDIWSVRLGENLTWTPLNKLKVTQRVQITPNVKDTSEFRARLELGLSYPLFKRVTLNLNAFDEYDSKPAAFVENNQLQVQSTVGVTF